MVYYITIIRNKKNKGGDFMEDLSINNVLKNIDNEYTELDLYNE